MKQSKFMSMFETAASTAIGFVVALIAQIVVFPWFGFNPPLTTNLMITVIFTVVSIARGYLLRRLFEALHIRRPLSPFMQAVIAERYRQIEDEGWSLDHDDGHEAGDLALASAAYQINAANPPRLEFSGHPPDCWRWTKDWWKPEGFRRDLVKAGALNLAEGEKFDRARKSRKPTKLRAVA